MIMDYEKTVAEQVTDILIQAGCTVNKFAVAKIVDMFLAREISMSESYKKVVHKHYEMITRTIDDELKPILGDLKAEGE